MRQRPSSRLLIVNGERKIATDDTPRAFSAAMACAMQIKGIGHDSEIPWTAPGVGAGKRMIWSAR
jgi:hypothetical protein